MLAAPGAGRRPGSTCGGSGVCAAVNSSGCSLACSAIHCCFVDVVVELSVPSIVSHQWVWTCDASLSSDGSRWPRFPAVSGTMKALRLLAPHALRLMVSPAGSMDSRIFVSARALPATCRPVAGPGSLLVTLAVPFQRFSSWARTGPHRFPGDLSRGSAPFQDPGRPVAPRQSRCFRCCPQAQHTEGVVGLHDFEAYRAASPHAVYASRRALPHAMQDSLPAGGLRLCRAGVEPAGSR